MNEALHLFAAAVGWLIVFASVVALVCLIVAGVARWFVEEDEGPWVVYRVAADGSGGVEFYVGIRNDPSMEWTKSFDQCWKWHVKHDVELTASAYHADVAPLSRFTGGS